MYTHKTSYDYCLMRLHHGSFDRTTAQNYHRHGWGIAQDPSLAITYLSQAASNSATIESQALSSGMKSGGAAKGELILAIFELANCFRHGWGVDRDPVAARSYYETAANLGDTDAMNEAAWCYEQGFGGKRDKVSKCFTGKLDSTLVVWVFHVGNPILSQQSKASCHLWAAVHEDGEADKQIMYSLLLLSGTAVRSRRAIRH